MDVRVGPACEGELLGKLGLKDWVGVEPELELRSVRMSDKGLMLYEAEPP